MGSNWAHKERSNPPNILEQEKMATEAWKVRTAFWHRRLRMAAQIRKVEPQVLTTELRRHFVTLIKH